MLYEVITPNPGAAEDFFATLNPDSLRIVEGARVEPSLRDAESGRAYQFEREGSYNFV